MKLIYLLMLLLPFQLPESASPQTDPPLLVWAKRLLADVRPESTRYQHTPSVVHLKGTNGAGDTVVCTDCSGFLNALLPLAYGCNDATLRRWLGSKRPLARHYYEAIVQEHGFTHIKYIADVKPGDILAIRYFQANTGSDTGHTMLVADLPKRHDPATPPAIGALRQWEVGIMDVTGKGHGKEDTRMVGAFAGGLGRGTFRIYSDDAGAIRGYAWSLSQTAAYFAPKERHLVIGRVREGFAP